MCSYVIDCFVLICSFFWIRVTLLFSCLLDHIKDVSRCKVLCGVSSEFEQNGGLRRGSSV